MKKTYCAPSARVAVFSRDVLMVSGTMFTDGIDVFSSDFFGGGFKKEKAVLMHGLFYLEAIAFS